MKQAIGFLLILGAVYLAERLWIWHHMTFTPLVMRQMDGRVMINGRCYTK